MARKKGLTINKVRSALYLTAKVLGDVQAVNKAAKTGSPSPLAKRFANRLFGKLASRARSKIIK